MHFDIFNNDAFSVSQLTGTINDAPHQPGRIGKLGLFEEEGIATTSVSIESMGTTLALVPSTQRGSPAKPVGNEKRKLRSFNCVHLPQRGAVNADEVLNLRAFGKESELETAQNLVNRKLAKMKRNVDATIEWQRIGAIKGQVLDADGATVLLDMFSEFGVAQQTKVMGLNADATKVKTKVVELKRLVEAELGALTYTGLRNFCSPSFFDAMVSHPAVEKAYDRWMNGEFLREDQRDGGFYFAGAYWEEYRGKVGSQDFITDGEAYAVPEGVAELFQTFYGPADYMETVGTIGLPYYAKQWATEGNKGLVLESQSNPLSLCTRPRAVVKLTIS